MGKVLKRLIWLTYQTYISLLLQRRDRSLFCVRASLIDLLHLFVDGFR